MRPFWNDSVALSTWTWVFSKHFFFSMRFGRSYTRKRSIRSLKPNIFENSCQGEDFQKFLLQCCRVAGETGYFGLWRWSVFSGFWLVNGYGYIATFRFGMFLTAPQCFVFLCGQLFILFFYFFNERWKCMCKCIHALTMWWNPGFDLGPHSWGLLLSLFRWTPPSWCPSIVYLVEAV